MPTPSEPERELNPEFAARQDRERLRGFDPDEVTRTEPDQRQWTEVGSDVGGVNAFRRMTDEEIERYDQATAKDRVKVQPAEIQGDVPR